MSETGTPRLYEATSKKFGFFVTPNFSPLGFFSALEVLRTANRLMGEPCYGWQVISLDGQPVTSANGVTVVADTSLAEAENFDMMFICSGYCPEKFCDEKTLGWIRSLKRHGTLVGAISTGTYLLASAGVIGDRRCTIHGDNAASLREHFPELELVDSVFYIDRNLYTCAGGTSAIDLFINVVSETLGEKLATSIAHQFQQDRVRNTQDIQSKSKRMNLRLKSPKLGEAIDLMEKNIEVPLSTSEIAARLKITQRQLQRLFKRYVGRSPKEFYVGLRIDHSRRLLLQTTLPIIEIAIASGFTSHGHFSKCYRSRFGYSPTTERLKAR